MAVFWMLLQQAASVTMATSRTHHRSLGITRQNYNIGEVCFPFPSVSSIFFRLFPFFPEKKTVRSAICRKKYVYTPCLERCVPLIPQVDAELLGDETDDTWREYFHAGLHAQRLQFPLKWFTPIHQRLYCHACTFGQLLFRHCFHKNFVFVVC